MKFIEERWINCFTEESSVVRWGKDTNFFVEANSTLHRRNTTIVRD
jgi:hypothetical protein